MTYEAYLIKSIGLQLDYVTSEQARMDVLNIARIVCGNARSGAYKKQALELGFHPLTAREIKARQAQLRKMARDVNKTHGDNAGQRAVYASRYAEAA